MRRRKKQLTRLCILAFVYLLGGIVSALLFVASFFSGARTVSLTGGFMILRKVKVEHLVLAAVVVVAVLGAVGGVSYSLNILAQGSR